MLQRGLVLLLESRVDLNASRLICVDGASEASDKWASIFRSHIGDSPCFPDCVLMLKKMCCMSLKIVDEIKSFGGNNWDDFCSSSLENWVLDPLFNSGFPYEGMDNWSLILGVTIWKLCK